MGLVRVNYLKWRDDLRNQLVNVGFSMLGREHRMSSSWVGEGP